MKKLLLIFLLILLLAACAPAQPSTTPFIATPTLTATETISPKQTYLPTYQAKATQWAAEAATQTKAYRPSPTETPPATATLPTNFSSLLPPGIYITYTETGESLSALSLDGETYELSQDWSWYPSQNGKLLFYEDEDLDEMDILNLETGDYLQDLYFSQSPIYGSISPDLEYWADSNDQGLIIVSLEDGNETNITPWIQALQSCHQPTWSPDGKWIAFTYQIDKLGYQPEEGLYILDTSCIEKPETCQDKLLGPFFSKGLQHIPNAMVWSPDSRYIVAWVNQEVWIHDFKTGENINTHLEATLPPVWLPDNLGIVHQTYDGICLFTIEGDLQYCMNDLRTAFLYGWIRIPEPTPTP